MKKKVLVVHGVATHDFVLAEWAKVITEYNLDVELVSGAWESVSAIEDTHRLTLDFAFKERTIEALATKIEDHKPDLIICHSMGQALTPSALRRVRFTGSAKVPSVVSVGGPMGNPLIAPIFQACGLGLPYYGTKLYHFWNPDDPIAAAAGVHREPVGWTCTRIAVPGHGGLAEHNHELYLASDLVRNTVVSCLSID